MNKLNHYPLLATLFLWPFLPHYRVNIVNELTPAVLDELGIQYILLDVDCTLKRYDVNELEEWVLVWLDSLKDAGIEVCLLSNGKEKRIGKLANRYDLPYEAMALKPLPFGCTRVMRRNGWDKKRTAMVGDQLMADVAAGKFAGITTIHVTPIHPEMEPIFTRVKRPLERIVFRLVPVRKINEPMN
ncbi:MAG: YqeG family HAD IIIA-type phosphatase [Planctomycetia bacterium]|nr:YqeG family HAD IIIA-type phosphatase [Planctomycetia bacterium]